MPEGTSLQPLINMAVFLVAVNLAYLRFEKFEHRERIKKYASGKLGSVEDVPKDLMESNSYKRLSHWAGINQDRKAVGKQLGWGQWYPFVFDRQRDRQVSKIMIWIALPVVLAGTVDASGLIRIPGQTEWVGWLLALLELMTVASVAIVMGGNGYISAACNLIDKDLKQWKIIMRDQIPEARALRTDARVPKPRHS